MKTIKTIIKEDVLKVEDPLEKEQGEDVIIEWEDEEYQPSALDIVAYNFTNTLYWYVKGCAILFFIGLISTKFYNRNGISKPSHPPKIGIYISFVSSWALLVTDDSVTSSSADDTPKKSKTKTTTK